VIDCKDCDSEIEDRALYIYTSGTTGLPKAANITITVCGVEPLVCRHDETGPADQNLIAYPCIRAAGWWRPVRCGQRRLGGYTGKNPAVTFVHIVIGMHSSNISELCRLLLHAPTQPSETRTNSAVVRAMA